jgi:hypothetical protein
MSTRGATPAIYRRDCERLLARVFVPADLAWVSAHLKTLVFASPPG